jgi:acyl dehydratase
MTTIIKDHEDLKAHVGQHLGYSDYITVTQEQVQLFADATGDHQWIHLDVEKAKSGPFGQTIAHGYLTLSLAPVLMAGIWRHEGTKMGVNYGANKIRFMSPVPVGGAQVYVETTFEVEGATKPSCVAELIFRYYY